MVNVKNLHAVLPLIAARLIALMPSLNPMQRATETISETVGCSEEEALTLLPWIRSLVECKSHIPFEETASFPITSGLWSWIKA